MLLISKNSFLFITLDSCRYDTYENSILPQMKKIVNEYDIGDVIRELNEDELLKVLNNWNNDRIVYNGKKENCYKASITLNWETEFENIYYLFL